MRDYLEIILLLIFVSFKKKTPLVDYYVYPKVPLIEFTSG